MLLVGTTFAVIYLQITIALPLTLNARGLGPSAIGLLLTVSAATVVLCQPLLAHPWLRGLDDFTASAVGYLVLAAGLLAMGFVTSLPAFVAATVVWSVGDVVLMGRAYTIVAGLAPATARGRYLAVYGTSWGAAAILAPLVGTQLLARGGPELTWTCITIVCLVLAVAQPALRRRLAGAGSFAGNSPAPGAGDVPGSSGRMGAIRPFATAHRSASLRWSGDGLGAARGRRRERDVPVRR
jgi:hypothetical protein